MLKVNSRCISRRLALRATGIKGDWVASTEYTTPLPLQHPPFTMSDFYLPPPEITARILNYAGQHVLTKGSKSWHERMGDYTPVTQTSASSDSDEQYWSFERSGGGTVCLVRNKSMNQVILASPDPNPVPISFANGSLQSSASACR